MERNRLDWPKNIWEYQTQPANMLDVLRTPAFLLTAILSGNKISMDWDWMEYNLPTEFKGILLPSDKTAHPLRTKLDYFLMHMGPYWQYACPIAPETTDEPWRFAFRTPNTPIDKLTVCTLLLEGPVRILLGPKPVQIYGVDLKGFELPLRKFQPYAHRRDRSPYPLI